MKHYQRKQKEASAPRDMELMDEVAQLRQQLSEARQEISYLRKTLKQTHSIITEAALTGFRPTSGTWAERLFENQQPLSAALKR